MADDQKSAISKASVPASEMKTALKIKGITMFDKTRITAIRVSRNIESLLSASKDLSLDDLAISSMSQGRFPKQTLYAKVNFVR